MRAALVAAAGLAMAVAPSVAAAGRWSQLLDDTRGVAWLHYELTALHDVDDRGPAPGFQDLVLAGARLHGLVSGNPTIGYHVGLDLAAGTTLDRTGLAYDVAVFPVGVALHVGDTGLVALGAGVGAMGAIATIDDAATFPLELTAELGGGIRLLARARIAYLAGAPGRRAGAPSAPLGDELDATLGLRIGHHWQSYGFPSGTGYFAGVSVRELAGTRFVGLTIGYAIDVATRSSR